MNRKIKIILFSVVFIIIAYVINITYTIVKYKHSGDWETHMNYYWIFKDSVKSEINSDFSYSYVKESDVYNDYHYKNYSIILWEFEDLGIDEVNEAIFNEGLTIDKTSFRSGEILNKNSDLEIAVKYGFSFENGIKINLDENSSIDKKLNGDCYQGFLGHISKLSLSNNNDEHQIILNYTEGITPSIFLIYEKNEKFYLIIINSRKQLEEDIINILNLDC